MTKCLDKKKERVVMQHTMVHNTTSNTHKNADTQQSPNSVQVSRVPALLRRLRDFV